MNSLTKTILFPTSKIFSLCIFTFFLTFFIVLATFSSPLLAEKPEWTDYLHNKIIKQSYGFGATKYHIFEPADPKPEIAPVIVFIHGYTATMPMTYQGWIDHIVMQGSIVIYPIYQASPVASPKNFPSATVKAVQSAFDELLTGDHVNPDLDRFAVVGHSMGGFWLLMLGPEQKKRDYPK